MNKILIADDDAGFCSLLTEYLGGLGFDVHCVHDGVAALEEVRRGHHELLVLDVMMPRLDGFGVLEQLRATQRIPVLMLTARGEDVDRIVGLELGADDYLGKPCNPRELAARIRAILRRARQPAEARAQLRCGALELLPSARMARLGGAGLALTSAEFDVLRVLVEESGKVVAKDALARRALNRPLGMYDRSIDMHVSRLRVKLDEGAADAPRIRTVRNRGYLLALDALDR
ncbi:MAG TPA: response regulator transcription factor [Solimonas sp.]|nr:response regulator transcription factor [Solimonas sp.]